jgi:hypothetical protein
MWFFAVGKVEKMVSAGYDRRMGKYKEKTPWGALLLACFFQLSAAVGSLFGFLYKA